MSEERAYPKPRQFDLNPGDFLADVAGEMTPTELGVYWMICLLQYKRRGSIEYDVAMIRAKFRREHGLCAVDGIVKKLIKSGRVTQDDDGKLSVRRVREEIERAKRRVRVAVESGARGGRPSKKINGLEKGLGLPTTTTTTTKERSKKEESPPLTTFASPPVNGEGPTHDSPKPKRDEDGSGRGARLSADWQPSIQSCEFGESLGVDVNATADEFRDYWIALPGRKATKLDWDRTFRNRCREVAARNYRQGRTTQDGANGHGRKLTPSQAHSLAGLQYIWDADREEDLRSSISITRGYIS
jgi:hypothetical protein